MENPYSKLTLKDLEKNLLELYNKKEKEPREFIFFRIVNGKIIAPGLLNQMKQIDELLANK